MSVLTETGERDATAIGRAGWVSVQIGNGRFPNCDAPTLDCVDKRLELAVHSRAKQGARTGEYESVTHRESRAQSLALHYITVVIFLYGDRSFESHGAGADFRSG